MLLPGPLKREYEREDLAQLERTDETKSVRVGAGGVAIRGNVG